MTGTGSQTGGCTVQSLLFGQGGSASGVGERDGLIGCLVVLFEPGIATASPFTAGIAVRFWISPLSQRRVTDQ